MIQLKVNGTEQSFNGAPEMPLLWYLRDILGLSGSKFGCGIGLCGACTGPREIAEDQLRKGATIVGAAKVVEEVVNGARTIAFA